MEEQKQLRVISQ